MRLVSRPSCACRFRDLPKSIYKIALQKSIPTQIRRLILYYHWYEEWVDRFVRKLTFAKRRYKHFLWDKLPIEEGTRQKKLRSFMWKQRPESSPDCLICEDRVLDGPASGKKGSKDGPCLYCNPCTQDPVLTWYVPYSLDVGKVAPGKRNIHASLIWCNVFIDYF